MTLNNLARYLQVEKQLRQKNDESVVFIKDPHGGGKEDK